MKKKPLLVGAAVLVSAVAVPALVLAAQPNGWHGFGHPFARKGGTQDGTHAPKVPMVFGKITAVNGSTLTVESPAFGPNQAATSWTVSTGATTVFKKDGQSASSADLAVDLFVMVRGTPDAAAKTVSASEIDINTKAPSKPAMPGAHFAGTVQAASGGTLTVLGDDGKTYTVDAFSVGEKVMVAGEPAADSTTEIKAWSIGDASHMPSGRGSRPMMGHPPANP